MQTPNDTYTMSKFYLDGVKKIVTDCEIAKEEEIGSEWGREQAEMNAYREIKEWLYGDKK